MTELPDNILHLPQYQVLGCKSTDDEMHFQVDVPDPIACEECGVQGEFVRFGKRDVPYRDLPIHGKRVTLWVVRRRYTCRACKTTFRPQLPEMVDGFRMTLRLHEYVEKESFNHPYTFVAAQTGLDEKTVRDIFNARAEFLGRWHRFETPRILGIDELYLNKRYRCILTNIEERTLLDLLATRRQDVVTNYLMKLKDRQKVEIVSMDMWNPYQSAQVPVVHDVKVLAHAGLDLQIRGDRTSRLDAQMRPNRMYPVLKHRPWIFCRDVEHPPAFFRVEPCQIAPSDTASDRHHRFQRPEALAGRAGGHQRANRPGEKAGPHKIKVRRRGLESVPHINIVFVRDKPCQIGIGVGRYKRLKSPSPSNLSFYARFEFRRIPGFGVDSDARMQFNAPRCRRRAIWRRAG